MKYCDDCLCCVDGLCTDEMYKENQNILVDKCSCFGRRVLRVKHTKQNNKLLLEEACKALGWKGGTIHQICGILSQIKLLVEASKNSEISGDWSKVRQSIVDLKARIY